MMERAWVNKQKDRGGYHHFSNIFSYLKINDENWLCKKFFLSTWPKLCGSSNYLK